MMKPRLMICGLLALLGACAFAQPENPQLRRSIENFYAKMDRHVAQGDCTAMLKHMDPNFVYTDVQGQRMNFAQMKAMMLQMRATTRGARCKTTVRHVNGNSQEAFAWVEMKMTWRGKQGGRWVEMKQTHRLAETLRGTQSGWLTLMTQELPRDEPWSFSTGGGRR